MTATLRRLLWPGLTTFAMLLVLLALGTWQVHRLAWKTALLAQIDHAETSAPVPLTENPAPFTLVSATGTFLPNETSLYGAIVRDTAHGPTMGARMIEPMRETNGDVLLVDRGWVPVSRPGPVDEPTGTVTVSGYVRFGDRQSWFSARRRSRASGVSSRWILQAIGAAIGRPVRPFVLVSWPPEMGQPNRRGRWPRIWPEPAATYAQTSEQSPFLRHHVVWTGGGPLAIFIVWARKGSRHERILRL